MAEFTSLDDAAIEGIASLFGLGPVIRWRTVAAGTINSNFAFEVAAGRFFLRVNEGKTEQDVAYEATLVEALADRGVSTPVPLESEQGHRYAAWNDRLVTVFPWVDGAHRELGHVSVEDARAVGSALARLHVAGAPIASQFHRAGIYTSDDMAARLTRIQGEADPHLLPFTRELSSELQWLAARAPLRHAATRGVIHGDLFRDNVLFSTAGEPLLLDFEQASVGTLAYDLAVCVNAWCFAEVFEAPLVSAMVAGYQTVRALGGSEAQSDRAALWTELRAAAMRFTVTRITDIYLPGLQVPGKEFERYFQRLMAWRELGEEGLERLLQ